MNTFRIVQCHSVEQIIAYLRQHQTETVRQGLEPIYRGHADSEYRLTPKIFRDQAKPAIRSTLKQIYSNYDEAEHLQNITFDHHFIEVEFELLRKFYKICADKGLELPPFTEQEHQALYHGRRGHIRTPRMPDIEGVHNTWRRQWPSSNLIRLMAMAQHYGLPTRLLDWSHEPLTALYFACETALEFIDRQDGELKAGQKSISVWATLGAYLKATQSASTITALSKNWSKKAVEEMSDTLDYEKSFLSYIDMVSVPAQANENVAAQRGVFTYTKSIDPENEIVDKRTLDEVFSLYAIASKDEENGYIRSSCFRGDRIDPSDIFVRFDIDYVYVPDLVITLHQLNYNAASIYPGHAGVGMSVNQYNKAMSLSPKPSLAPF